MCFHCWAHIEKEENEITKHLRIEHGENTKKGHTLYDNCKIIPEQVAVDLTDQETADWFNNRTFDGYNRDPKSNWATVEEIKTMYRDLNKPVPTWVDDFVLPPSGNMGIKVLVDIDDEDGTEDEEDDGEVPAGEDGSGEDARGEQESSDGEDEAQNGNSNASDSSDQEMTDVPAHGMNQTANKSPSDGTHDSEEETDGPPVYLPYIDRGASLEGPLPPLKPGYKVYSCYECENVHGHLETMFLHYNAKHNEDLQARFAKVYNGRYFLHAARNTDIGGEEFIDKIHNMRTGPDLTSFMSRYYIEDKWAYRCYLCGDEERPTQDFYAFDQHFATHHMEERWGIVQELLATFK